MNAKSFISESTFSKLMTSIIDLENSNLPLDYFTSVLPRAQYGDESAAVVGSTSSASTFKFSESDPKQGALFNAGNSNTPVQSLLLLLLVMVPLHLILLPLKVVLLLLVLEVLWILQVL